MVSLNPLFPQPIKALIAVFLILASDTVLADSLGCPDNVRLQNNTQNILVYPNGFNDTTSIQCALDAAVNVGYPTVRLAPGTFYTHGITVENFYGNFEGSGKALTRVEIGNESIDCTAMHAAGRASSIFRFVGGEPRVRYMTVIAGHAGIGDVTPLHYLFHLTGGDAFANNCNKDVIFAMVDRVRLEKSDEGCVSRSLTKPGHQESQ